MDKCKIELGYNAIPPPYTRNFMPPKPNLVYPSLDDFVEVNGSVSESIVEKPTVETNEPETAKKENGAPIIEDWVSDSDEKNVPKGNPHQDLKDKGVIDSGCSRHMIGNRSYLTDYEEIDGGFVSFRGNSKGGKITRKDFKLTDESHVLLKVSRKNNMYSVDLKNIIPQGGIENIIDLKVKVIRCDNGTEFKNKAVNQFCEMIGRKHALSFMRPFRCPVTILNTIDHLGYSTNSKTFRVFNSRTKIVDENLHVQFSKNTPNIAGSRPNWLFDINALTKLMNYKPGVVGNQPNGNADTKACDDVDEKKVTEGSGKEGADSSNDQAKDDNINSTNNVNTVSLTVNAAGIEDNVVDENIVYGCADDPNMTELEDIVYSDDDEDVGVEDDMNNLDAFMSVSPILTTRIHKDHPVEQIIRDLNSAPQRIRMTKNLKEHGLFSSVQQRTNHKDFQNCLFACFLSQEEPRKVIQALKDPCWIEAMQDELLQFKLQKVWTLVDLPNGKRAISTKWVYRNKKDERGIVIKNKVRLVAQGYTQEEGIEYDEVFAPIARIEAIRLFLAYASFKDFVMYQMDVKSAFLYDKIEEEVYVCQPPRFEDQTSLRERDKGDILLVQVYVDDIIFGSTKKSLCTEFEKMMYKKFQMSSMGELTLFLRLQMKRKEYGIFISQDKYVTEILKKFGFSDVKIANTPIETHKPLLKDVDGEDVDEHLYRSMIGSLMYLTSLMPDIMFVDPPFDLVAFTDSDYAGSNLDRKSTTRAEYIAAFNCYGQVLWIQNQMLDYGYNFMHTKIYIDNESTICIVKNLIFHSKTKHIEIRHHFIRDSNEKKLIQMIKIHIDQNVVDFLTKAFDIIHKGWLEWNAKDAKDGIGVKTINLRVNTAGHYLVLLGEKNANFAEIVDFLNANPIRYALIVSLTIYVSCIEQFWSIAKTKTINNETQIHAKVEGKTIVISESSMRRYLQFDDEDEVNAVYDTPSHTKKIFANIRRQGKDFLGTVTPLFSSMLVQQADMGEGSGQPTDPQYTSTSAQPSNEEPITVPSSSQPKKTHKPRKAKRATKISQYNGPISLIADETVTNERDDIMERDATTASSLESEQNSGSGPRCQDTILGDAKAQTRFETASKQSNDPPLSRFNTLGSGEDRLKLKELIDLYTKMSDKVLDLETTKTAQAKEIASLKKRV
ncbi:putative ribonuclease H-like domain-containing protein [Tanacetum coccineum]